MIQEYTWSSISNMKICENEKYFHFQEERTPYTAQT